MSESGFLAAISDDQLRLDPKRRRVPLQRDRQHHRRGDDQQAVDEARLAAGEAARVIDRLFLQAGCLTIESLELVEGQSAQRAALAIQIRESEARLVKSAGLPLAEALRQADGQEQTD